MTNLTDGTSDYNQTNAHIRDELKKICTSIPVKVIASYPGGVSGPSYVDIQPAVNLLNIAAGTAMPHKTIERIPVFRYQGGGCAIIIDPVAGDMGDAIFAMRDISSVKTNMGIANPGSLRMLNWADAVYYGGILNGPPTVYIQITSSGVTITGPALTVNSTGAVTVNASQISLGGTGATPVQLANGSPSLKVTAV